MTKTDIIKRINELEDFIFFTNMKEDWSIEDHCSVEEWCLEISTLKKRLRQIRSEWSLLY